MDIYKWEKLVRYIGIRAKALFVVSEIKKKIKITDSTTYLSKILLICFKSAVLVLRFWILNLMS